MSLTSGGGFIVPQTHPASQNEARFSRVAASTHPPKATHGRGRRSRRRGLVLAPQEGVYASIPVCRPAEWLHALEFALTLPSVEALRRRLRVAGADTVLAAAVQWATAADTVTGRDVAVSHATVAGAIGYAEATVKRIMRFLSRLGFVVECARGRNRLTLQELATARALGAREQRTVASTRALTIPPSVDGTPLPLSGNVNDITPVKKNSPKRAKSARPPGASRRKAADERTSADAHQRGRTIEVQQFAAQLVARLPRLLRTPRTRPHHVHFQSNDRTDTVWVGGRHIGQVCDAVVRHRLIERGWSVQQVLDHVDRYRAGMRRDLEPEDQRDPLSWLFWLVSKAIPNDELGPRVRADAERAQRRTQAEAREREETALRERIASQESEIDTILATMNRQFPPRRTGRVRG